MLFTDGYMLYDTVHLLPVTVAYIAVNIYLFSYVANIVIITLCFFYRYLVICRWEIYKLDPYVNMALGLDII